MLRTIQRRDKINKTFMLESIAEMFIFTVPETVQKSNVMHGYAGYLYALLVLYSELQSCHITDEQPDSEKKLQ